MILKKTSRFIALIFLVFVFTSLLNLGTFCGLDSDFQAYALYSKLIWNGQTPYVDFFSHKPPLFFYLLLPGNMLGGRLISFFSIHLICVGLVTCLLFYYAATLKKEFSLFRGVCAWLFFCMVTTVQFFDYGNLNGSIIYVSIGFNLVSFFLLLSLKERIESGWDGKLVVFLAGVCSGLSFLTRFGMAPNFVFLVLLAYLIFQRKVVWKDIITLVIFYGAGFLIPVVVMLFILGFPLKELYEHLIEFNSLHSRLNESSFFLLRLIARPIKYGIYLIKYTYPLIIICSVAFYYFLKAKQKKAGKLVLFRTIGQSFKDSVTVWLIIYLLAELFMVGLQGTGPKQYPFFAVFAPLSLLAAISLEYLTTISFHKRFSKQLVLGIIVVVFLLSFGVRFYNAKDRMISIFKWPESQLVSNIKRYAENERDLFTLDFQAYVYLETGLIPPIGRNCYIDWHWDFLGTKPEMKRHLWEQLENNPPSVVTRAVKKPIPDSALMFMSNYREVGIYPTNYSGDTMLYVRKEVTL